MKYLKCLLLSLAVLQSCAPGSSKKPADYVNPFIDSHKSRWFFFSSASRPFGMVNLSPDTWVVGSWNSGYLYDSLYVRCFSHVHAWQLAGIPVMPTAGKLRGHQGMEATKSSFSHDDEIAKPGYHKIVLQDYGISAELTSTCRVGFHRYTYPATDSAYVNFFTGDFLAHGPIDSSMITVTDEREVSGFSVLAPTPRRPKPTYVYFTARFDRPFTRFIAWQDSQIVAHEGRKISGKNVGAAVGFKMNRDRPLLMKVAISYTSIEQARKNMETELPHWDFDKVAADAQREWNEMLGRIEISGGTEEQRVKFYTDLWHALLGRRIASDVDGKYCDMTGSSPLIRQVRLDAAGRPLYPQYNFDALWGSQWTLNVLWSMAYPEIMDGFCNTMVNRYHDGGLIPRGPSGGNYTYVMIGDPAASFFATACNKGIRNYDEQAAYEGLRKNAFPGGIRDRAGYEHGDNPVGGGMNYYVARGYVPEGLPGSGRHKDGASMTLEYAYQDWCLGQLAKALGKGEDYQLFNRRSQNYRNLWNPETGFMHPRNLDGTWIADFQPVGKGFNTTGFCESNSAMYTNFVPHDLDGLMKLFGGAEQYTAFVNSSFDSSKVNRFVTDHGKHAESWIDYENQPSCQMAHLFNFSGAPWLTQKWVREVKEITFGDTTAYGGYNGDEDQGQMGALGVLMAIGLFQMDGGASVNSSYEITSPIFDETVIHLNSDYYPGGEFRIVARNNSADNMYIQSAQLNREDWPKFHFPHDVFANGGMLELQMGNHPNKIWGTR